MISMRLTVIIVHTVRVYHKVVWLPLQTSDISGTPHNALVVGHVTIHRQSNLISTFQWLVGYSITRITAQKSEPTRCTVSWRVVPVSNIVTHSHVALWLNLTPQTELPNLCLTEHWPPVCSASGNFWSKIWIIDHAKHNKWHVLARMCVTSLWHNNSNSWATSLGL